MKEIELTKLFFECKNVVNFGEFCFEQGRQEQAFDRKALRENVLNEVIERVDKDIMETREKLGDNVLSTSMITMLVNFRDWLEKQKGDLK